MAGRPKKPQKLHVLHGTNRADRDSKRAGELQLESGDIGQPPDWISPEARAEWVYLMGTEWATILAPADRSTFLRYCILFGRNERAERGLLRWDGGLEHPEAFEKMGSQEPALLHQLAIQLGLTPAARSKVQAPKAEKPKNKWAELG